MIRIESAVTSDPIVTNPVLYHRVMESHRIKADIRNDCMPV